MPERFYEFGLSDEVLKSIEQMGFEEPTQIQKIAIPPLLKGHDIIGVAQTGTGKTAAFGIPIVEKNKKGERKLPSALVMVPTRELAMQVAQELNMIGRNRGFIAAPIYGGQSIERQIKSLGKGVDIVVSTPGRLLDHIRRRTIMLSAVTTVVLDEADEMLNMGFVEDIEAILKETPAERQTMLFSATMPPQIVNISRKYMNSPKRVSVDTKELVAAKINQVFYEVRDVDKIKALTRILDVQDPSLTLIFCHTKRDVDELSGTLKKLGYDAGAIHGDFTQAFREEMIIKFKRGIIDILVATDVAARGLDINDVTHVINYSIPQNPEAYVHRIGRTGRAGKSGIAITFVTPREYSHLRMIERTARTKITKGQLPSVSDVKEARKRDLVEALDESIQESKHNDFKVIARELFEKYEPEEAMAAALSLMAGSLDVEDIQEIKSPASPAAAAARGPMQRLLLTVGRKDNIRVGDVVRTISERYKIPGRSIGHIALFDDYSFVEVPATVAEHVISSITDLIIGGKKVKVKSAGKSDKPDRKPGKEKHGYYKDRGKERPKQKRRG